jgi:tight adherence protein C
MTMEWLALCFGLSILLAAYWAYSTFTAVPQEDRRYLDRPAYGFRLVWPLVRLFVHYFGEHLSVSSRKRTLARLRKAGIEYSLSPEQFLASKWVGALVASLAAWGVSSLLQMQPWAFIGIFGLLGYVYADIWLREISQAREKQIFRALPFYLDAITLAVESGSSFTVAMTHAVNKAPPGPLTIEFNRVLRDVRAGKPRAEALRTFADRVDMSGVNSFVSSVIQAEKTGANLGPVLRAQADQRRTERFTRAEKMAMEAPVKMLGPLILFIFPNTFLVLTFLIMTKAILANVLPDSLQGPLTWALQWPGVT